MRAGLIAKKVGMTRVFSEGLQLPVTVLQVENPTVVGLRTQERDGYTAVILGSGEAKQKNTSKAQRVVYNKLKIALKKKVVEFRVEKENLIEVGKEILASHFVDGQNVDVVGTTIGKGFAGGMKRHGFGGLEASHGISVSHRSHGSTGQCQDPGRVFKGKKMAGHMGNVRVTAQNLEVVKTDDKQGLIFVKGAVPGSKGSYVEVKDAVKSPLPNTAEFPAKLKSVKSAEKKEVVKAKESDKDS